MVNGLNGAPLDDSLTINCGDDATHNCNCASCVAKRTENDANFRSEQQRKFMWSQHPDIAEDWAHGEHSAESDHKMPEETGPDVHVKDKSTTNTLSDVLISGRSLVRNQQMPSLMERFINLFTSNADQGRHPATGQFQGTHSAQATRSFQEAVGTPGVKGMGSQKTKDGRNVTEVDRSPSSKMVEADEEDDHQIDDAPGRTGAAKTSLGMSSIMNEMAHTYNTACAILNTNPEAAQVYNIDTEIAYNRAWPQSRLDTLPESDFAGPSQTFPIANQQDLDWALSLVGKANNPEQVRNKLVAIAGRKGLVFNALPPNTAPSSSPTAPSSATPTFTPPGQAPSPAPSIDAAHSATKQAAGASLQSEHSKAFGHAQGAMQASGDGDSDSAQDMHGKAAGVHEKAATKSFASGDNSSGDNHLQAAALHRKAAAMHAAVNNARSNMGKFFTTNMPAGGAFQGAVDADFDRGQAAAMAGKLEGSYSGEGGGKESPSGSAREASAKAKKTGSAKSHKAAASAHREAAEWHDQEGNAQESAAHTAQAKVHDRAAKKATNNARILQLAINGGHLNSAVRDQLLYALNTSDESGSGSFDSAVQVGGEEDDDTAADDTPGQKVKVKGGSGKKMSENQRNAMAMQLFGLPADAIQSVLTSNVQAQNTEKSRLILNMTQHLEAPMRGMMVANLQKFDLDDLQAMATLNPMVGGGFNPTINEAPLQAPFNPPNTVNFLGAGAVVPTVNGQVNNGGDNDILALPTMNMDCGDNDPRFAKKSAT